MSFAAKKEVFDNLFRDPEWKQRFDNAKTAKEAIDIVTEYAKSHGYRVGKQNDK